MTHLIIPQSNRGHLHDLVKSRQPPMTNNPPSNQFEKCRLEPEILKNKTHGTLQLYLEILIKQ